MDTAVLFGAGVLVSVLPLVIITSSLANHRLEVTLSRHLGLGRQGARVIASLFTSPHSVPASALVVSLLLGVLGTLTVALSLQRLYERIFSRPERGMKGAWRLVVWLAALGAALAAEGLLAADIENVAGHSVILDLFSLLGVLVFMLWTMHFLLAGRVSWRRLLPSAVATAVCAVGLEVVSAIYLPSSIVSDSKLYGSIGVVFTLVSWFIAIGAVLILGGVAGEVWDARRSHRRSMPEPGEPGPG